MLDLILVLFLMYQLYKLVKGTAAIRIFLGALSIYALWQLVQFLGMGLLSDILGQFIGVGVIALIVVFQQEIRRFLLLIATPQFYNRFRFTKWLFKLKWQNDRVNPIDVDSIIKACTRLSESKTGALIVVSKYADLKYYHVSGDEVDAHLSSRLLEAIFNKESPLHDGAVIVSGDRIVAARCVLPVSEKPDIPADYGLRHRAALGITENSHALAIVVSEQTGDISFCKAGVFKTNIHPLELKTLVDFDVD